MCASRVVSRRLVYLKPHNSFDRSPKQRHNFGIPQHGRKIVGGHESTLLRSEIQCRALFDSRRGRPVLDGRATNVAFNQANRYFSWQRIKKIPAKEPTDRREATHTIGCGAPAGTSWNAIAAGDAAPGRFYFVLRSLRCRAQVLGVDMEEQH